MNKKLSLEEAVSKSHVLENFILKANTFKAFGTAQSCILKQTLIKKYKKLFAIILVIGIILLSITGCSATRETKYQACIRQAEQDISDDKFEEAKKQYEEVLKYKKDSSIQSKIELCTVLDKSLKSFNSANNYLEKKEYLDAYNEFSRVAIQDEKRYTIAKEKLVEASNLYTEEQIAKAADNANNSNYKEAIKCLDDVFVIDRNNNKATELKNNYQAAIKQLEEQKRIDEENKKQAELKAKQEAELKDKQETELMLRQRAELKTKHEAAQKQNQQKSETVYVTKAGDTYHLGGCKCLNKSKIPISLENAKLKYSPCSECHPPQ